uniref:N-acetylglucosamine kinase n=1 Tax=Aquiluna sp. TaxID=2053504 RepID=UPI0040486118
MTRSELFVDAGQSAVRARLRTQDSVQEWTLPKIDTSNEIAPQILSAIQAVFKVSNAKPWQISISSTALSDEIRTAEQILAAVSSEGVESLLLAHDSIAGYLAALGHRLGAVSAVGTGVVTLGVGPMGFARVDGWGNIIGDAGSGFWIGRAALDAAMRAFDGRGQQTLLLELMKKEFPDIPNAYLALQSDPGRVARIASFSRETIELSKDDPVAKRIVDEAVEELVLSISAALRTVGFGNSDNPSISWVGNVARNQIVSARLRTNLLKTWPNAEILEANLEPIDGVELMSQIKAESPISSKVTKVRA